MDKQHLSSPSPGRRHSIYIVFGCLAIASVSIGIRQWMVGFYPGVYLSVSILLAQIGSLLLRVAENHGVTGRRWTVISWVLLCCSVIALIGAHYALQSWERGPFSR